MAIFASAKNIAELVFSALPRSTGSPSLAATAVPSAPGEIVSVRCEKRVASARWQTRRKLCYRRLRRYESGHSILIAAWLANAMTQASGRRLPPAKSSNSPNSTGCDRCCAKPGNRVDREKCAAPRRVGGGKEPGVDGARIRCRDAPEQDRCADSGYRPERCRPGQYQAQQG